MSGDGIRDDSQFAGFVDQMTEVIATRIVSKLGGRNAWIDQHGDPLYDKSPLGRNRHCAAVRRRVRELPPDQWECAIVGRRHIMSPVALSQELGRLMIPREPAKVSPEPEGILGRLQAARAKRRVG